MSTHDAEPELFSAGTCGITIALRLLRSLAQQADLGEGLLTLALGHSLPAAGIRAAARGPLCEDVENWLGGVEPELNFRHAVLAAEALLRLEIPPHEQLNTLLMRRAYGAGRRELATRLAGDTLAQSPGPSAAALVTGHDILGRVACDEGRWNAAAEHFSAGAATARAAGLDREEWDQTTNKISALQGLGDHVAALAEIAIAERIARRINDARMLAKTLTDRGNSESALGNFEKACAAHEEVSQVAERAGLPEHQSNALGNLGNLAFHMQDYGRAEEFHQQALAISRKLPDQSSAQYDLNNLAQTLWQAGRSQEALEYQTEALALARRRSDERNARRYAASLEEMRDALGHYHAPVKSSPPNPATEAPLPPVPPAPARLDYTIEKRVRALLNENQYEEAKAFLEEQLRKEPDSWQVHSLYAVILVLGRQDEVAWAQFERAIELGPVAIEPHARLVELAVKSGRLETLLERYEEAVRDQPFRAPLRVALAMVYMHLERPDDALRQALEAVNQAPSEELALRMLAEVQFEKAKSLLAGYWDAAWGAFQECANTLHRLSTMKSEQRGQWLTYAGRIFETFALESHRAAPPVTLGMDSRELSILAHAAHFYRSAGEADPLRSDDRPESRVFNLINTLSLPEQMIAAGSELLHDGYAEQALMLALVAVQRDPGQPESYHLLAKLVYGRGGTGSREEAMDLLQRAIRLAPDNEEYRQTRKLIEQSVDFPGEEEALA